MRTVFDSVSWAHAGSLTEHGRRSRYSPLSGRLESILVEPFEGNYRELVDHARQRLAERGGA